jgi:hypothetical protein
MRHTKSSSRKYQERSSRDQFRIWIKPRTTCDRVISNFDENRISDWEDRKTQKVFIHAAMLSPTRSHKICRNVKHISVIVWVSAPGESHPRYIVRSQFASLIQDHVNRHRLHFGRDWTLKSDQRFHKNANIFLDYISIVFFPFLVRFHDPAEYAEEIAVLSKENC